ncbi:PKD domain-containing protein [Peribacillus loiseleuriae]|uniref:PKD domain-containing protein n=1 Tax=Peribacillus loiseleuriae TaxID=1679170 RepID=UPI003CFD49CE
MRRSVKKRIFHFLVLVIFVFSSYFPIFPFSFQLNTASAATITVPPSSVDSTVPLTVSPSLNGEKNWKYDGITDIFNHQTGQLLGQAYRYKSSSGAIRNMVSGTAVGEWPEVLNGNRSYVLNQLMVVSKSGYTFQPPSPKTAFERYLISDVFDAAGAEYSSSDTSIRATPSKSPKVNKFSIRETPEINSCYKFGSTVTVDVEITEYIPNQNKLSSVQVYLTYPKIGQASIFKEFKNVNTDGNGKFSTSFNLPLNNPENAELYIRAYDGIQRIDQDSLTKNNTVGSVSPVGLKLDICTKYVADKDSESLPIYDYTNDTLLSSNSLEYRGFFGRTNSNLKMYPSTRTTWFGPLRYPTIFYGNPDDGGKPILDRNSTFIGESGTSKTDSIYAYQFPFQYVTSPIDPNVAKPGGVIHNSIASTNYNIQMVDKFNVNNLKSMFNGNPNYMIQYTPKHKIQNPYTRKDYGQYYWIRELAETAGGDAENFDYNNPTNLAIFQTDYPDIGVFETKEENTYKKDEKLYLNFNGYEYVSDNKAGNPRNILSWEIKVVDGPANKGGIIKGQLNSTKSLNNSSKPQMKKYDGKYQSGTTYFTPGADGKYTLELTINDQVQRATKSRISVQIGDDGGVVLPDPEEPGEEPKVNNPPSAQVSTEAFHYWPEVMNISTIASDPDEGDELTETIYVDGKETNNAWSSNRVTEKTKRNVLFTVVDKGGLSAEASTTFETWPTLPTAMSTVSGSLKQNRAVILDAKGSDKVSPVRVAPIDYSRTKWEITPITEGLTQDDIKIRPSSDPSIKQLLFKKPGKYKAELIVTNIYDEESQLHVRELDIVEDVKPLSLFTLEKATYLRDAKDGQQASIKLTDNSTSSDGDTIQQRIWYVEFDGNNDGVFGTAADGGKQVISSSNEKSVTYKTNHVGHYRFSLEVKEAFGEPTYEEFVLPHEYLRDRSDVLDESGSVDVYKESTNFNIPHMDKVVEVDNVPPVIDFGVRRANKVEVVLDFGGMDKATLQQQTGNRPGGGVNNGGGGGTYNHKYYTFDEKAKNALTAYAGNLETSLRLKGIDAKVVVDSCYYHQYDLDGTCVQNIPVWNWVDHGSYSYSSYSGTSPYSGSWEVTSSSSRDIYNTHTQYASTSCSSPCLNSPPGPGWSWSTGGSDSKTGITFDEWYIEIKTYSHTEYTASLRQWVSNYKFEITSHTSEGCSSTEQVDTTDFTTEFANRTFSDADYKFYFRMDENQWTWRNNASKKNLVINKINSNDVYFWENANNTLRTDVQSLLSSTGKEGNFTQYSSSHLQSNVQKVQDYLINRFMIEEEESFTIVLGDKVDYTTEYTDYENDPELQREWKFVHDPTTVNGRVIDDQPKGPIAQSGLYISSPMQLNEVGTYTVTLRAKDNPLANVGNDNRFSDYRKWSDGELVREYKINVHRRPIADFTANVEAGTLKLTLNLSSSYDPDHQYNWSELGLPSKGIVEYTWEKYVVDGVEHTGAPPATLQAFKDYFITLRVKDVDGAYGTVTKHISTQNVNLKPVALFDSPSVVLTNTILNDDTTQYFIKDRSYDPNGDDLTNYNWTIKRQSDGTLLWSGANYPSSFASIGLGAGKYLIGLTVWDIPKYPPSLQSDLYESEITVVHNNPPISCFELSRTILSLSSITCTDGMTSPHTLFIYEPVVYTDKSSDPDGHPLINYSWTIEKLDESNEVLKTWNTGSAPVDFSLYGGIGIYRVTQTVFDLPPSPLPSLSGKITKIYNVIKGPQAPYAMFDYTPLLPIGGNTIQLNDQSWDEDGNVIQWEWTIVAPNGSKMVQTVQNPKITNAQVGTYKVTLHVWDDTSPTRLKSNVPAYKEIVVDAPPANQPPVPLFVWAPFKPFIGGKLSLDPDGSYDLDGEIVSYQWQILSKEGSITNSSTRYPELTVASEYYDVTLTVSDNDGATANLTQRINVNIARLEPLVTHTDEWKKYWVSEGHDEDIAQFLAGEKFVIRLKTTPANRVEGHVNLGNEVGEVSIPSSAFKLVITSQFEYVWEATLWQENFEKIPYGQYLFELKGYYPVNNPYVQSNGNYLIEIVGNVYEVLGFHRNY